VDISQDERGLEARVWGRAYRFDQSALPTSLVTQGRELLAGPVRLTGLVDDQAIEWEPGGTILYHHDDVGAVILGYQQSEKLILNTAMRIEYDGMMTVDLTVMPEGKAGDTVRLQLSQLALEVPLKPDAARLFHYWPQVGMGTGPDFSTNNSGAVPPDGLALPFKPFLWLGWEEGGLSWFAESDRQWQVSDETRAIEVLCRDDAVTLRLNLLDTEPVHWKGREGAWRHQFMPLVFRMGLQATPLKPMPDDFHEWRIVHTCSHHRLDERKDPACLDRLAASGVKTIVIHESSVPIQNSGFTDRPDELREVVAACHRRGIKVLIYFGYELSTLSPRWADEADTVLVKSPDGVPAGGWRRGPHQRELICCYRSHHQDTLVEEIADLLERTGVDGLYLDQTSVPFGCANESHGCGYRGPDGERRVTFPILAVRNLMKRLCEVVQPRGGRISLHQSSGCVTPTLAFVDSYFDGEHLIWHDKFKTDPAGAIGLAAFRAEFMGKNFGIPAEFNCQAEAWALPLIHDVLPRPSREVPESLSKLWDVMTTFGVAQSEWHPYWRNQSLLTARPDPIKASVYVRRRPDDREVQALLVVANLSPSEELEAKVTIQFQALGADPSAASAADALSDEPIDLAEGQLRLPLKPLGTKVILLRVKQRQGA